MDNQSASKRKWIASLFIFLGSVIVLSVVSHLILNSLYGENYIDESFRVVMTVNGTVLISSIVLTYLFLSIRDFKVNGAARVIALTFIGFFAYIFCDVASSFIKEGAFFWQIWEYQLSDFLWLGIIFLGALSEELTFRKYFIDFSKALGANLIVSILISSILFALFHLGGLENPVPLIISGVVYCIVTVMTKSIAFAVGAHFGYNLLAGIDGADSLDHSLISSYGNLESILLDVGLLAIFLLGYYLYTQVLSPEKNKPTAYSA